jgi:hypothetical protein
MTDDLRIEFRNNVCTLGMHDKTAEFASHISAYYWRLKTEMERLCPMPDLTDATARYDRAREALYEAARTNGLDTAIEELEDFIRAVIDRVEEGQ